MTAVATKTEPKPVAVSWAVARSGFQQDHRAEYLQLNLERPSGTARLFGRAHYLLTAAKNQWRSESPEWQAHGKLLQRHGEAEKLLATAKVENERAAAAVREAVLAGNDPASAEALARQTAATVAVLENRVQTLSAAAPRARQAALSAWESAWPQLLRNARQQLADELLAVRDKVIASIPAEMLDALAKATGECQLADERPTAQGFSQP
jgi:hypothetical protein